MTPAVKGSGIGIGDDHFARAEPGTFGDARLFEIDESGFGADHEQTIVSQRVAHGAQAVAVELCADVLAVGKNQCRRTIPRFTLLRESCECATHIARK